MTREEFYKELLLTTCEQNRGEFIQKFLVHGTPFVFEGRESAYYDFRKRVADKFEVQVHEVFIVGSAKLGFSLHKQSDFTLESDIDLVIVNDKLFDQYHYSMCEYQYQLDRYYQTITVGEMEQFSRFMKYFIKGWMRPDLLPSSFSIEILRDQWFNYFRSISNNKSEVGNYKVSGGLFKNLEFFEKYHIQEINRLHEKISING